MVRFIGLTDLAGERVWVGASWVQAVLGRSAGSEYREGCNSVLEMSGYVLGVRETPDEVYDKLCAVPSSGGRDV